ncbi:hypothetical protein [Paraburkholderia sp. MM5482-R1]|uniref:hypothetical protein n=1 Tax=Paraburkholderia sp. MM5482-R1 TaxID=2991063 RepID=UPI003D1F3909
MANTTALLDFNFIVSPSRTGGGAKADAAVASIGWWFCVRRAYPVALLRESNCVAAKAVRQGR